MAYWWVDRVLPGVVSAIIVGEAAYARLHFEERWPYWGRTGRPPRNRSANDRDAKP